MEYNLFKKINRLPKFIRYFVGVLIILYGLFAVFTPAFGACIGIVLGLLCFVKAKNIPKIIKIRKGLQYLCKNFSTKSCCYKWYDFKNHLKSILKLKKKCR
jgi:hypothetical protein